MSLFAEVIDAPIATPAAAEPSATPAAPSANPSSSPSWINLETGEFGENWRERLPEDLRGEKSLALYKDLPTLVKSFVETKKMVGKRLERPGPDAPPEKIAEWRALTGAPKDISGYGETLRPDDIPETMWDKNLEGGIKEIFNKHHAPPELLKEVVALYGASTKQQIENFQVEETKYLESQKSALSKEWGQDTPRKLEVALRFAQTLGLDPTSPEFANAAMVKAMYAGATLYSGSTLPDGGKPAGAAASVRDQIADIQDPGSSSRIARDYRGENGKAAQLDAQAVLHNLMGASTKR